MPPVPPEAATRSASEDKPGFDRKIGSLFAADKFNSKLLLGTITGVLLIVILTISVVGWTYRNRRRAQARARGAEVVRLASLVASDIAALENAYRGHLLSSGGAYLEDLDQLRGLFAKDSESLGQLLNDSPSGRKQFLKLRNNVQTWLSTKVLPNFSSIGIANDKTQLAAPELVETQSLLQEVQQDAKSDLSHLSPQQDGLIQTSRVLEMLTKMHRAIVEMEKEMRGCLLTGDSAATESYGRASADLSSFEGFLAVLIAKEPAQLDQLNQIRERMQSWITECATPAMAAKREGRDPFSVVPAGKSESRMNEVRRLLDKFEKEQTELYLTRSTAASRHSFVSMIGVDLLCILVAALMIAAHLYSFFLCRRQLKKVESADIRIQSVIDQILDGMITIDEKGKVYSMNPAAKQMFGYGESEPIATEFAELIPTIFLEGLESPIPLEKTHLAERTGKTTCALACSRKGETRFPVEISLSEMLAGEKRLHVAMIRDITERKRFEEALAAEKKSLAVTLGSIGEGVITIDLQGRVLVCNPAAETLTGWPEREAIGQPIKEVLKLSGEIGPRKKREVKSGFRSEAEAILLNAPERSTLTSRDGAERVIEQVVSPTRDGKNELCGAVLVFRDITERQRDEVEARKAETLDQLGLLAGGIAHDFNNLLTAIIGNISLAAGRLPPEDPMVVRLEDAKNASLRARDLASQLLTFARGGAPIKKTASITKVIEETVSFSLRGSHSRSEFAIDSEIWSAEFDQGQISQVIGNLVVNADQAMPHGGTLHVSCSNFSCQKDSEPAIPDLNPGDYIRIQVRDEGTGIPEKNLKQIFDPYFTTKPKGSGLGLATTYSIIKNHGGLITVESELGAGAIFTVYLPAARHQPAPVAEPVANKEEPITGSGRVLIVDDEEPIRDLVTYTLTNLGYEVSAAETALRGIELYREAMGRGRRFDLVILDLTLPGGMGGREALKRLLDIDPTVNSIVSSGYALDATMSRSEDFGFRGMIAKPYEAAELGRVVRETIASSKVSYGDAYELQHAC